MNLPSLYFWSSSNATSYLQSNENGAVFSSLFYCCVKLEFSALPCRLSLAIPKPIHWEIKSLVSSKRCFLGVYRNAFIFGRSTRLAYISHVWQRLPATILRKNTLTGLWMRNPSSILVRRKAFVINRGGLVLSCIEAVLLECTYFADLHDFRTTFYIAPNSQKCL